MNGGHRTTSSPLSPIEFRRKVIMKPAPAIVLNNIDGDPTSPMSKLLKEEHKLSQPTMIPAVELHPLKLKYSVIDGMNQSPGQGFVLVSRRVRISDALHALLHTAAPKKSSSCKRLWSKRDKGTKSGDGFEVVDISTLDGHLIKRENSGNSETASKMLTGEWVSSYGNADAVREIHILVECRSPKEKWSREALELGNRIQVCIDIVRLYTIQLCETTIDKIYDPSFVGGRLRRCARCSWKMVRGTRSRDFRRYSYCSLLWLGFKMECNNSKETGD
jgi:hypothetical protein